MTYEVGETVVYPHHGAARIIDIRQRKVRGEEKTYLQLEVAQGDPVSYTHLTLPTIYSV